MHLLLQHRPLLQPLSLLTLPNPHLLTCLTTSPDPLLPITFVALPCHHSSVQYSLFRQALCHGTL
jgi:hypothetical protein